MGEQKYMVNYKMISELIVNILRVSLIRKIMDCFLPQTKRKGKRYKPDLYVIICCIPFYTVFSIYRYYTESVIIWE